MSDNTFNVDLDAMVRGEDVNSSDDLTRFVADLYAKEQNVTMPNTMKLRIANELGLSETSSPTIVAPISRRTLRATESSRRHSRSRVTAFAIAAAILLIVTGVLRWGMPMGTNEPENRLLLATPAAPTVAVSPEADWMRPIDSEECIIVDSGELPEASIEEFEALSRREYVITGHADEADAWAASETVRQFLACDSSVSLLSERYLVEAALAGDGFSPVTLDIMDRQLADGISISAQLVEQGHSPEDALVNPGDDREGYFVPNPEKSYVLEDGRILVTYTTVSSSLTVAQPQISTVLIVSSEDGELKIDDHLPICIGSCDEVFAELESMWRNAFWLFPIGIEECELNTYLPEGLTGADAAAIRSRQYRACEMSGDAQALQGPDYRVTEGDSAREVSEEINDLYLRSGEVPGSLQRIAGLDVMSLIEYPSEPWTSFQPESVVELGDGRTAVLETSVMTPDMVAGTGRTSPVVTSALIWIVNGENWLLDEELTVCLGSCDSFWDDEEEAVPATPVALVIPETCDLEGGFVADFSSRPHMPIGLRPGPGNASGVSEATIPGDTPLQYLCESAETTNPTIDRMEEGQVWLKVQTKGGIEGWIREVDVRDYEEDESERSHDIIPLTSITPIPTEPSRGGDVPGSSLDPTSTSAPEIEPLETPEG